MVLPYMPQESRIRPSSRAFLHSAAASSGFGVRSVLLLTSSNAAMAPMFRTWSMQSNLPCHSLKRAASLSPSAWLFSRIFSSSKTSITASAAAQAVGLPV